MSCTDTCCRPEYPTFLLLGERQMVAHKPQVCATCTGVIDVGESYRRDFVLVDGDPVTIKWHVDQGICVDRALALQTV